MAEIGHSTLKRVKPLALVDAAWEDICSMVMQEQEHSKFLEGRSYSFGKGPNAGQIADREKKEQRKRSKDYQNAFKENMTQATDTDPYFVPSKKARHNPPLDQNVFSIQGSGNVLQEINAPQEPTPQPTPVAPTNNPPLLTTLHGFQIKSCYGCKGKFAPTMREAPKDLILKMKVKRDRLIRNKWVSGWKYTWGYFHLDINCVKLENPLLEVEDFYIPNDVRGELTPLHIQHLQKKGWWEKMRRRYWYVVQGIVLK